MKKSHFKRNFIAPEIYGALLQKGEKKCRTIANLIEAKGKNRVFLSFVTEKKHLKNLAVCMNAMDITGLTVSPSLSKSVTKCIRTASLAKGACPIDTITRDKELVFGRCICLEVLTDLLRALNLPKELRSASLFGLGLNKVIAQKAIKGAGFKLVKTSDDASINITAKRSISIKAAGKTLISERDFSVIFNRKTVGVLTGAKIG